MNTLFKADPKKTSIPLVENIPAKEVYFSHSILSDLKKRRVTTRTHPLSIISKDSLNKKRLFINYLNPSTTGYVNNEIIELKDGMYKIKNEDVELILVSKKKPFMHHGKGNFIVKGKKVFYYSFTNMGVEGIIRTNGKEIPVEGKAWMDHEWAGFAGEKKWNWFSIQLDGNVEMMIQEYNGGENVYVGINGKKPEFTDDLILVQKKKWKSRLTGAEYPVEWKIVIPSKSIYLDVKAPISDQEILFGSLNYWEGPISVSGTIKGKKVKGRGFMELTGRKMKASKIRLYEHQLRKEAGYYLDIAKKEAKLFWKKSNKK
jgi:predicted secreted hydrolase